MVALLAGSSLGDDGNQSNYSNHRNQVSHDNQDSLGIFHPVTSAPNNACEVSVTVVRS